MEQKIYMIGNAHIDPVWLWNRREGYAEIKATFRAALDRMEQFPGFIFTSACASYYKWIEENEPPLFEEIRERIRQGRWAIAGGMWVQPDCNIPSGESFVRHFLYSQRYFLRAFGKIATVGYNVDSFGHNGMLPQLLRKAGIEHYVFMRPGSYEKELPRLFTWESPDGSRVTAYRIDGYGEWLGGVPDGDAHLRHFRERITAAKESAGDCMWFYGVGNHGGGPTVRCLTFLEETTSLIYASPEDFFETVEKTALPVVREDLQHHASGCYSAGADIKRNNRLVENRLLSAEKYDVLAVLSTGCPSGKETIKRAYEKLLFNQFHDVLAGCSIESAIDEANRYYSAAWVEGNDVAEFALQKLSWNINTAGAIKTSPSGKEDWALWESDGQGAPVVVFNPHSFPGKQLVQLNHGKITGITDEHGAPVGLQRVRGPQNNMGDVYNTLMLADIPAYGYRTYYLYTQKELSPTRTGGVRAFGSTLENNYTRVDVSGIVLPVVIDDSDADTWGHGKFAFNKQIGEFAVDSIEVTENGPLRATIRVRSRYNNSTLVQDFSLDSFSDTLLVRCKLDFHERYKMVKLAFPVDAASETVIYETPFGFIEKPCNGEEEPGHRYVSLSGLALLNDGKYSFSAENNTLYMTIARGCGYADHYGGHELQEEFMDQGRQTFSYALMPHKPGDFTAVTKRAMLLNQGLEYIFETNHGGRLSASFSGIEVSGKNVVCETVKFAEDENALVLRLYETAGSSADTKVTLRLPKFECNFILCFTKHEVKTVMIDRKKRIREMNLLELIT